jgi:hypothetical protein
MWPSRSPPSARPVDNAGVRAWGERHKVVSGIVLGLALLAAFIWIPKLGFVQPSGLKSAADRAKAESDFRGHLIQAVGGLVLAAGAYFTGRTFALNRESQHTERFTRAIEQLASEKLDVRLGGIHALNRIAHDSSTYYVPVMEVLTAFLRENARWRDSLSAAEKEPTPLGDRPVLRFDLQAAATAVARRDLTTLERRTFRPNLFGADLTGAELRGAQLAKANLRYVNLSHADLCLANLSRAEFGDGSFARTLLIGANLRDTLLTTSTDFTGADFRNADLMGAIIPGRLEDVDFRGANLSRADLGGAIGLTPGQLDGARTDEKTRLPAFS